MICGSLPRTARVVARHSGTAYDRDTRRGTESRTIADVENCEGCARGEDCDLRDGVDAALLEVLSNMNAEDTVRGTRMLLERGLSDWHDCRAGREALLGALTQAEESDANALGTMLLLARRFDLPGVTRLLDTLTNRPL